MVDSEGVDVLENEEQQSEQEHTESDRDPSSALTEEEYEDITDLVILMDEHDLAEVEFEDTDRRIRLKKQQAEQPQNPPAAPAPAPGAHQPQPGNTGGGGQGGGAASGAGQQDQQSDQSSGGQQDEDVEVIKSPLVGTFYRASSPEADPYVEEGDEIDDDTVVCIIEAMKVMNEIKAEMSGTVKRILVNDGEAVDFDEPLFEIATD